MDSIDENLMKLLDNYSDNLKIINESKKNINIKLTILILSLLAVIVLSPLLLMYELPVYLLAAVLTFSIPQIITLKMQGSYYKNIKNILKSKKDVDERLKEYSNEKNNTVVKEKEEIKKIEEEIGKHNLRQKELEIAFSDENYFPYIERIKSKTLKK